MIGKYERDDAMPSIEAAKKIADAFEVSLDYLVGEGQNAAFDKKPFNVFRKFKILTQIRKRFSLILLIPT